MRAEVEANVKSRVESLELKNQTLQHQLDDFTHQHRALEQEYKNAVDKLNDAKNDAKMNPTGTHNFIHSCMHTYIHTYMFHIFTYIYSYTHRAPSSSSKVTKERNGVGKDTQL